MVDLWSVGALLCSRSLSGGRAKTEQVLTAVLEVTQVKADLGVQGEAPGRRHLATWIAAEVVAELELWVFLGQVVAVGELSAPRLAAIARPGEAQGAPVVCPTAVETALLPRRICTRTNARVKLLLQPTSSNLNRAASRSRWVSGGVYVCTSYSWCARVQPPPTGTQPLWRDSDAHAGGGVRRSRLG